MISDNYIIFTKINISRTDQHCWSMFNPALLLVKLGEDQLEPDPGGVQCGNVAVCQRDDHVCFSQEEATVPDTLASNHSFSYIISNNLLQFTMGSTDGI